MEDLKSAINYAQKSPGAVITVEQRQNYGNDALYVTSGHKEALFQLTGRKTLSKGDIQALKSLGYTVELEQKTVKL